MCRASSARPRKHGRRSKESPCVSLGVHIFLLEYDPDTSLPSWQLVTRVADGAGALGAELLILSGRGGLDREARNRKIATLRRASEYCRIDGMHLHDYKGGEQVPVGQGEFDLKPLAAAVRKTAWHGWLICEEERAQ